MNPTLPVPTHRDWHAHTQSAALRTGITMHYMEAGVKDAEPLLLIHGFTDSSRIWRQTICALGDRFHIFAVDLRGFGQTDQPKDFLYTPKEHADDLAAFLDAVGVPSAYVLAHSMGTMIAQTFAFLHPSRVKKLLLAAAMLRGHDTAASLAEQYDLYATMDLAAMPPAEMQERFLPYPENCRDAGFPMGYFTTLRGLSATSLRAAWFGVHQADNRGFVQFIKAPLLILWGDRDDVLAADYQDEVRQALPETPYVVLPGISHEVPNEMPEKLAQIAADFFLEDRVPETV